MRLPNERLMSPNFFKQHADKLVERKRIELEVSLNSTKSSQIQMYVALILGVITFLIAFQFLGVFMSLLIGGGTFLVGGLIVEILGEKHPPEYGVWHCTPETSRNNYCPGGNVTIRCKRVVDDEIVEEIMG